MSENKLISNSRLPYDIPSKADRTHEPTFLDRQSQRNNNKKEKKNSANADDCELQRKNMGDLLKTL